MLEISFGNPQHGWLPVHIRYQQFQVNFDASDVPIDPVSHLADILAAAVNGGGGEVLWHLEPGGYFMMIASIGTEYSFRLDFCTNSEAADDRRNVLDVRGSFDKIVVPVWQALKRIQSENVSEFHVSETALKNIEEKFQ